jgi:biotin-dependent carboxylase-like uncharacterized protein
VIEVVRAGLLDLVVDGLARRGLRYGLSESGPLDRGAMLAANRAVGNGPDAAALELLAHGPVLALSVAATLCLVGGALEPILDDVALGVGRAFAAPAGAVLSFRRGRPGLRAYLAVRGGFAPEVVLGSRSADLPSALPGLAGRALRAGDRLAIGDAGVEAVPPGGSPPRPQSAPPATLRVLPGPQWPITPAAVRRHLLEDAFRVTPAANRVGVVLEAARPAPVWAAGDMVSEGTLAGSVQWTPAGRPVLLLVDRGSIGGYPKPLQVIAADVWAAGQLRPGDAFRFVRTSRREAVAALLEARREAGLDAVSSGIVRFGGASTGTREV